MARRAAEILNDREKALRGARIVLLGVSYKAGSGDVRESPALRVAARLATSGADLSYHDPYVPDATINGVVYESKPLDDDLLDGCDLAVILTDHPGIDYRRVVERAACTYDTRGATEGLAAVPGRLYRA